MVSPFTTSAGLTVIGLGGSRLTAAPESCRRAAASIIHDNGDSGVGAFGAVPANGLNTSPRTAANRLGRFTDTEAVGAAFMANSGALRMRGGVHSDDWVGTGGAVSAARPAAARGDASQSLIVGALLTNWLATTLSVSASLSVDEGSGSVVRAARRSARGGWHAARRSVRTTRPS